MPEFTKVKPSATGGALTFKKTTDFAVGESLEGVFVRKHKNTTYNSWVYHIFTLEHEMIGLNGSTILDQLFEKVADNTYIRLTHTHVSTTKSDRTLYYFELGVVEVDDGETSSLKQAALKQNAASAESENANEDELPF